MESSPEQAARTSACTAVVTAPTTSTTCAVRDVPSLPTPTSQTLHWPLAALAPMRPTSHKALAVATAVGLATAQRQSVAEAPTLAKTDAVQQPAQSPAFTLGANGGLGKRRIVAVDTSTRMPVVVTMNADYKIMKMNSTGKVPVRYVVTQSGSGRIVSGPRPLVVQRGASAGSSSSLRLGGMAANKPYTQTIVTKLSADNNAALVPAVHTSIRQIYVPRVIAPGTPSVSGSAPGCRVIRAKTVTVPRLPAPTGSNSTQLMVLTPQGLQVTRGIPVPRAIPVCIGSPVSTNGQAATTGKDSPLSCIQTLVANAGTATQMIAMNNGTPDYDGSTGSQSDSDVNDTVLPLAVGASNNDSHGTATDTTSIKQASGLARKRLSETDDNLENKVAKQS